MTKQHPPTPNPRFFYKGQLWSHMHFCVSSRAPKPRDAVYQSVVLLSLLQTRPLLASSFLGGKAGPSPSSVGRLGLSQQAPAGCTPEECRVSLLTAIGASCGRRCCSCLQPCAARSCAPLRAGTLRNDVLSMKLHTSDWGSGIVFFLSDRGRKINWFNGHDCIGCLFPNRFPKHGTKSEL